MRERVKVNFFKELSTEELIKELKGREDIEVIDCKEEDLIGPYHVSDEIIIKFNK
ncbi:hypothetical protein [Orenia metallireducens]|uniref:hypothetical protein n=1 Tax=Orenia metallireducens TaxID=1413210 RepID=UPI00159F1E33|nr:hypothetical protein [Orenia metallireducens]